MRLEIFVFGITAFLIYNAYSDGKYTKMLMSFKKYYKMIFYAAIGFGVYYMLKKNPTRGRDMLLYANNMIKGVSIDKSSMDMISPVFDFTSTNDCSYMEELNGFQQGSGLCVNKQNQPRGATKRSVSETKKKYVAYNQGWKCGNCKKQLDHTFEIDHRVRLEYGGSNDVDNLVALCRNCHGIKTASENM